MIRTTTTGAVAAIAAVVALTVSACGGGDRATGATGPPPTGTGGSAAINSEKSGLGTILDTSTGLTLYLFKKDVGGKSACTGGCASAWPPLRVTGKPLLGTGLKASLVGTVPRTDGRPQVTYNGHPVYTYTGDTAPGDTNGQGVTAFGGGWFALSPAGAQIAGKASTSSGAVGY
jgi:predicted lipoprotein with Yx(FWY)xxD motif